MRSLWPLLVLTLFAAGYSTAQSSPWSTYPRDGRFKKLSTKADPWFFVDEKRWTFKAPDKWQHYSGCYVSQKLIQNKFGKLKAFLFTETIGILKEVDDGFREGWSPRDLFVDNLGIIAAMISNEKIKFTGSYDSERVVIKAHFLFK